MKPISQRERRRVAAVFRSARKHLGLTQKTVAQTMGLAQGTISKVEQGHLLPNIFEWLAFAELTDIPVRACEQGYIDWKALPEKSLRLKSDQRIGAFKVPLRYALQQGASVREVCPWMEMGETLLSEEKLEQLLQSWAMDPDYLIDYRNQINLQLSLDLVDFYLRERLLTPAHLDPLAQAAVKSDFNGSFANHYARCNSVESLLQTYAQVSEKVDGNFRFQLKSVRGSRFEVAFEPQEHVEAFSGSTEACGYLADYRQHYLRKLVQRHSGQSPHCKALNHPGRISEKCFIQLTL